jgi:hypothetical protein
MQGFIFNDIHYNVNTHGNDKPFRDRLQKYFAKKLENDDPMFYPPCGEKGFNVEMFSQVNAFINVYPIDDIIPHMEDGEYVYPFRITVTLNGIIKPEKIEEYNTWESADERRFHTTRTFKNAAYHFHSVTMWMTKDAYKNYYDDPSLFAHDIILQCLGIEMDKSWDVECDEE